MMKMITLVLITIAIILGLSACGRTSEPTAPSTAATNPAGEPLNPGQIVYKNYCISCHGGGLQGAQGPNLQKVGERLSKEMIINKIQKGGGGMPAFKVSIKDEDLQAVAEWLSTLK
jgi:cytochrome c551